MLIKLIEELVESKLEEVYSMKMVDFDERVKKFNKPHGDFHKIYFTNDEHDKGYMKKWNQQSKKMRNRNSQNLQINHVFKGRF